jgi:hypothetical protein
MIQAQRQGSDFLSCYLFLKKNLSLPFCMDYLACHLVLLSFSARCMIILVPFTFEMHSCVPVAIGGKFRVTIPPLSTAIGTRTFILSHNKIEL